MIKPISSGSSFKIFSQELQLWTILCPPTQQIHQILEWPSHPYHQLHRILPEGLLPPLRRNLCYLFLWRWCADWDATVQVSSSRSDRFCSRHPRSVMRG
ncbi:hypothetical protein CYMTET_30877 [Cymbomonas tetramitiformis]|uniref:Uncharacterized protein n=1 Tax=Cymbomonas tetramitiformis TaxID=36881 RepID=A0AAE0FJF6_9CHLO|nr:hypothetical protein CYMTET_30877 [Cymbomonas tetramitiformis]